MQLFSKIIDADIYINGKKVPVLNTDLEINLEWSINFAQKSNSVDIEIKVIGISGYFHITDIKEAYKKETKYTINQLLDWHSETILTSINLRNKSISPEHITLDFDKRQMRVKF